VIEGQKDIETKQPSKSINLHEIKDIQPFSGTNQNNISKPTKDSTKTFKKNIMYKCASVGFSEDGKLYSDKKVKMDTLFHFSINNDNVLNIQNGISLPFYMEISGGDVYKNQKKNIVISTIENNYSDKKSLIIISPINSKMQLIYNCVESGGTIKF